MSSASAARPVTAHSRASAPASCSCGTNAAPEILRHLRRGVRLDLIRRRRPGVGALLHEVRQHADADRRRLRVEPGRAGHGNLAGVALVPRRDPGGELQAIAIVEGRRPVAQRDPRAALDRRPVDGGAAADQREAEERVDQLAAARVVRAGLGEADAERVAEHDLERLRGGAHRHELQATAGAAHLVVLAGGDEHARDARRQRRDAIELLEEAVDARRCARARRSRPRRSRPAAAAATARARRAAAGTRARTIRRRRRDRAARCRARRDASTGAPGIGGCCASSRRSRHSTGQRSRQGERRPRATRRWLRRRARRDAGSRGTVPDVSAHSATVPPRSVTAGATPTAISGAPAACTDQHHGPSAMR